MLTEGEPGTEKTLDPQNWESFRRVAHEMLDDAISYLSTVRQRPVWQPPPPYVRRSLREPPPIEGEDIQRVYEEFKQSILPYPMGNIHPRFWGWVIGTGTPLGMLTNMLVGAMNPSVGGGDHVANYIEMVVLNWFKEILGYPTEASGLLVSGCSVANLISLAVARNEKVAGDIQKEGLYEIPQPVVIYGSTEIHSSLQKAIEVLGLGNRFLRRIPVDGNYQMDTRSLREYIVADLTNDMRPACIIGNAGTVNTGAIDPLDKLADIAEEYNMWLHVDGAFGALVALSDIHRSQLRGLDRADSLAFDLHKWLHLPYDVGCVLIRDEQAHRSAFSVHHDYIDSDRHSTSQGPPQYMDYGLQLSREFRALKVWMALKTYGLSRLGQQIDQNIEQAAYLADLIRDSDNLELLVPPSLNIVCFRFVHRSLSDKELDDLNRELLDLLRSSDIAVLSSVILNERFALRCAITNHRTRKEDLVYLAKNTTRIGRALYY